MADNGGGEISTLYTPTEDTELCDGKWHSITGEFTLPPWPLSSIFYCLVSVAMHSSNIPH